MSTFLFCLSVCLPACLSDCLPICLFACLSVCLPVCLFVCVCRVYCSSNACCCSMCHTHLPVELCTGLGKQICLLKAGMAQAGSRTGSALHQMHEPMYCPPYVVLSDATKSDDLHAVVKTGALQLLLVCMLASLLCIICNYSTPPELYHI